LYISDAIHGGGVGTTDGRFHSRINMAQGQKRAFGRMSGEVFTGSGGAATAFEELIKRAVGSTSADTSARDNGFTPGFPLILSPGGGTTFQYPKSGGVSKACISEFTLDGNLGGNVTFTSSIVSAGRESNAATPGASTYSYEQQPQTNDDSNPLPYWASQFSITGSGETDVSDRIRAWDLRINNNTQEIFTFNGSQFAFDILQGVFDITGSFSYYSSDGNFVNSLTQGAVLTITLGSGESLIVPFVAFGEQPIPLPGLNAPTVRNVNWTGLATINGAAIYRA